MRAAIVSGMASGLALGEIAPPIPLFGESRIKVTAAASVREQRGDE